MAGEGVALALFAALSFGLYTVVLERGMARAETDVAGSPALGAAFLSTVVAFAGFWIVAFATGVPVDALTPPAVAPFLVAGVVYPALFRMAFFEGIDRIGAGVSAAVVGAYPAVSALLATAFLGEVLTLSAGVGIALIVAGVGSVRLSRRSDADDAVSAKLADSELTDLLYPIVAMACFGGSLVLIKYGLDRFPDPVTATALTQTSAFVALAGWVLTASDPRAHLEVGRPALGAYALSGVFIVLAWLSQFFALQLGTVITVAALVNTYPLIVLAMTYALARQIPRSPRIIAGVVAIVVGATLVQGV